jgi:hypothetical protein
VSESDSNGRPGVGMAVAWFCTGILAVVWGFGELLWGRRALGVFAIVGIVIISGALDYYFRDVRRRRSGTHGSTHTGGTNREG